MPTTPTLRYFLTYRGVALPLLLTEELTADALSNRNTYFRAAFDADGRMLWVEKLVYGAVDMRHDYRWGDDGTLCEATVSEPDEEPRVLRLGAARTSGGAG
jgi:hypothetical protein